MLGSTAVNRFLFCSPQGYPLRNSSPGRTQNQSAALQWSLLGTGRGAVATGERWSHLGAESASPLDRFCEIASDLAA